MKWREEEGRQRDRQLAAAAAMACEGNVIKRRWRGVVVSVWRGHPSMIVSVAVVRQSKAAA